MIFDSHAHYDSEQFDIDRDELLGSVLPQKGVVAVINMAADYESLKKPWRSVKIRLYLRCSRHPPGVRKRPAR